MKLKKNIAFLLGVFLTIVIFLISCAPPKPKPVSMETVKVVFENGDIDTLKLISPVEMADDRLYQKGDKVANNVSYFKKIN